MSPVRTVTHVSGPDPLESGAGDGNRTHVRSLGSFYTAIVRRPLVSVTGRLYTTKCPPVQTARSPFCKRNLARIIELAQVSHARWRAQQIPLPGCFLRTLNRTVLPTRQAEVSE